MMKKILGLTLVFMSMLLIGCSEDRMGDIRSDVQLLQPDNSRIKLYNQSAVKTMHAAANNNIDLPVPGSNVLPMYGANDAWSVKKGEEFIISTDEAFSGQVRFNDNKYYVYGELNLDSQWVNSNGGTIYVMPGGILNIIAGFLESNVAIVNAGTINLPDKFVISQKAELSSLTDIFGRSLTVSGRFNSEASVNIPNVHINNNAVMRVGQCVISQTIIVDNNSELNVGSYLKAEYVDLRVNATLILAGKVLVEAQTIEIKNPNSSFKNYQNEYAVISCDKLIVHHTNQSNTNGWIDIHAKTIEELSASQTEWLSTIKFNGNTHIEPGGCKPEFGKSNDDDDYRLNHLGKVEPVEKDISATGIDFAWGKAYVSWHLRGNGVKGYIDVIDIPLALTATLYTPNHEYNHIYTNAKGEIYTAGNDRKAAFIAKISYDDQIGINVIPIKGASGNCLIEADNNLIAVSGSNGGVSLINNNNVSSFTQLSEAKYITPHNDKILVMAGIDDTRIYEYDMHTGLFNNNYSIGSIVPDDGKNVLVSDNECLYAALGKNGVKKIRNGIVEKTYNDYGAANGLDVDDKYVYVANGTAGLLLLHKDTFKPVIKYTLGGASANFVRKGTDGLIYVSYGLKGVNVFELIEPGN